MNNYILKIQKNRIIRIRSEIRFRNPNYKCYPIRICPVYNPYHFSKMTLFTIWLLYDFIFHIIYKTKEYVTNPVVKIKCFASHIWSMTFPPQSNICE